MTLSPVPGLSVVLPSGTGKSSTAGSCAAETSQGEPIMPYLSRGPRIFAGLCEDFIASPVFQNLAQNSRQLWGRELRAAGDLDQLGCISLKAIRPRDVRRYLESLTGRPGKQAAALSALRAMARWAEGNGFIDYSFCYEVKTNRPQGGHKPWTDHQVATGISRARPDIGRVIVLGACTGQRGSDLVRMGWADIQTLKGRDWIKVRQQKTGREFMIPIIADLAKHMQWWPRQPGPFLRRQDGQLWEREALTHAWAYERRTNPELAEHHIQRLHLHGLRSHACVRLYLAGATTRQVAQTVGMSEEMVGRYTRLSSQLDEASAAIDMLERKANN